MSKLTFCVVLFVVVVNVFIGGVATGIRLHSESHPAVAVAAPVPPVVLPPTPRHRMPIARAPAQPHTPTSASDVVGFITTHGWGAHCIDFDGYKKMLLPNWGDPDCQRGWTPRRDAATIQVVDCQMMKTPWGEECKMASRIIIDGNMELAQAHVGIGYWKSCNPPYSLCDLALYPPQTPQNIINGDCGVDQQVCTIGEPAKPAHKVPEYNWDGTTKYHWECARGLAVFWPEINIIDSNVETVPYCETPLKGSPIAHSCGDQPCDVPAVRADRKIATGYYETCDKVDGGMCTVGQGTKHPTYKVNLFFTCADKSRILMTAEDGKKYCHKPQTD
jgi:hypothetical protein